MKILTTLVFTLTVLVQAGSARAEDGKVRKPATVVLKGLDPVSLLDGKEVSGSDAISSTRGSFRYLFANAEHKSRFDAKPDRFSVQGEKCTLMPDAPASPDLFHVHEGKIFLFGTVACLTTFKADPASVLAPKKTRKVAVLIFDGMDLLDFAGPGDVFSIAGRRKAFEVFTVAVSSAPIKSHGWVTITPQYTFATCPQADIVVVPGGGVRGPLADPATLDWIRKSSGEAEITLSICNGALLLAKLGLLDGMEATTHHGFFAELRTLAPRTKVHEDRRYVDNGRIVTSAGISAGIDASLHLVSRLEGPEAAAEVAKVMEYPREPEKPTASH